MLRYNWDEYSLLPMQWIKTWEPPKSLYLKNICFLRYLKIYILLFHHTLGHPRGGGSQVTRRRVTPCFSLLGRGPVPVLHRVRVLLVCTENCSSLELWTSLQNKSKQVTTRKSQTSLNIQQKCIPNTSGLKGTANIVLLAFLPPVVISRSPLT